MTKVDFKIGGYFSENFIFLGILMAPTGLGVLFINLLAGIVICVVSLLILTTHYRLEINPSEKTYREYLWMLGFKSGSAQRYLKIEYFYIKKSHVSQQLNSRVSSTTLRKVVYDAYLKFSESEKIHVGTRRNKDQLIKKIQPLARQLEAAVVDQTE